MNEPITDQTELVERLRRQVNALAEYAARLDANVNDGTPQLGVTQATTALARDALMQMCEVTSPGQFSTWVDDRIAAAHMDAALGTARRRDADAEVWLDQHTARRGYDTLAYFTAHALGDDRDAAVRAGLELADLLKLGDEVRGPFLNTPEAHHA